MAVSFLEKLTFTKHLATMIKAGITVNEALASLENQTRSRQFKKALKEITASVINGNSLSKSLSKHPHIFDQYYVSFVGVGEESGNLEENLGFLATQLAKEYTTQKKVQGALLYPALVFFSTIFIGGGISFFVLPKLVDFFDALDVQLPLATRILLGFANIMKSSGLFIFVGLILFFAIFALIFNLNFIKPIWQRLLLAIPLFGPIFASSQLSQFTRNIGTLLKSGVPIDKALDVSANASSYVVFRSGISRVLNDVQKGKSLTDSFKEENIFPSLVDKMIAVGEKSGKLDESFLYLADFYDEEVDNTSRNLSTLIEPVLLLFIGVLVGFVALAIISPIYQLTGSIGRQ